MNTQVSQVINGVYHGPEVWEGDLPLRAWNYYRNTLTSLGCLREVTGSLNANGYSKLVDLGDLTTVGDYLDLDGCHNLKTLGKLTTVGGTLDVENCSNLVSLGNLTTVRKYLHIIGCDKLASIENLKTVGEDLGDLEYAVNVTDIYKCRIRMYGDRFLGKVKYYQTLPLHEALNAIHTDEVQSVPLYRNILLNKLQGVSSP